MNFPHVLLLFAAVLACSSQRALAEESASPEGIKLFNEHVHAILVDRCVKCHGGQKTESELDLATRDGLLKGGVNGAAIVPGDAAASYLVKAIKHEEEPHMPENGPKLSAAAVAKISQWIDLGAPYSKPLVENGAPKGRANVTDADRQFWSFRPLGNFSPPDVADEKFDNAKVDNGKNWCRTPVDAFILAKLSEKKLYPNGEATKRQLIRRATFDLIGLPPTPEEIAAFEGDASPDAYEKLIDRLLASPHYGERWGRHWLDLARFAESHGYEQDYDRPNAYHYRDFVIRALNADMPYDQFLRWQIAGDELAPDNPEAWCATGFLAAGTHATQITANQAEKERYDELDDKVATIGTAMLGLTIGCARCHDHKFDPIPTADYYRMIATFTKTVRSDHTIILNATEYEAKKKVFDVKIAEAKKARDNFESHQITPSAIAWLRGDELVVRVLGSPVPLKNGHGKASIVARLFPAYGVGLNLVTFRLLNREWQELNRLVGVIKQVEPKPKSITALVCSEGVKAVRNHTQGPDFYEKTFTLKRGDLNQKVGEAKPGFLQVLHAADADAAQWRLPKANESKPPRTPGDRAALANWLTDVDHGAGALAARVAVNRLWQHHFGRGIVATPSDFGSQGAPPIHPELLDYLASELVRGGWRLKPMHKLIMTSSVYRQSPDFEAARAKIDPDNLLHWRRTRQRLEAEAIRDAMLAASGTLDRTQFGPGSLSESQPRRSIYFTVKRSKMIPLLTLFDGPDSLQGLGQRSATTVAPQALWMLNNKHVRGYAEKLAARVRQTDSSSVSQEAASKSPEQAVRGAYEITLGRYPTDEEVADAIAFIEAQTVAYNEVGNTAKISRGNDLAWTDFCQSLFAMNEFVFVE